MTAEAAATARLGRLPATMARARRGLDAWVLPSDAAFDVLRICVLNSLPAMFFLYFGVFWIENGSFGYETWADALVVGQTLAGHSGLAWRDIGYPLILVLSGFPWTHSFIGLAVVTAAMGFAMPVLGYFTLRPWFPRAAYWAAMACVVSFAPLLMFKYVHHDQPYIFFMMVTLWSFSRLQASRRPIHLYGFTLAAFAMSLIRLIGQGMYPPLLLLAWLQARVHLRHILGSAVLFAACTVAYSNYRAHVLSAPPPVLGEQVFYNVYTHLADDHLAISPELGPNSRGLIERLRQLFLPSPARSPALTAFIDARIGQDSTAAPAFWQDYFLSLDADRLVERMLNEPNVDYYLFIINNVNDRLLLLTAFEVLLHHPGYVAGYTFRNALILLCDPGYTQIPFAPHRFEKQWLGFPFSGSLGGYGYNVNDAAPQPALSEARYLPLLRQPHVIQTLYFAIDADWRNLYQPVSKILFGLMMVAWLATAIGLAGKVVRAPLLARWSGLWLGERVIAASSGISLLLLLNVGLTALLVDPVYRFDHSLLLLKILLAAVGGAVLVHLVRTSGASLGIWPKAQSVNPAAYRPWPQRHVAACAGGLAAVLLAGFVAWGWSMRQTATAVPAEGTVHVTGAGSPCGDPGGALHDQVASACTGKQECEYLFDRRALRDPGAACRQSFHVEWTCTAGGPPLARTWAPPPPHNSLLRIACP